MRASEGEIEVKVKSMKVTEDASKNDHRETQVIMSEMSQVRKR